MFERIEEKSGEGAEFYEAHSFETSYRTPSEQLRKELGWKTLEERRSRSRLYVVHKCVTGQAPASLCQRVKVNTRNTRGRLKLVLPRPTTDFFKKTFCFRGAQDWNALPSDIRTSNTSTTFRARLRRWM